MASSTLKSLVSILDFNTHQINDILDFAEYLKHYPQSDTLAGKIIACCFFEASTRTRLSFESAIHRLGGEVIGFSEPGSTSLAQKGESFEDTIRVIGSYADAIVIRHPEADTADRARSVLDIPVINAGDGGNQHPTQTLLDLFTIKQHHGALRDLNIMLIGDLKHSRTIHSLVQALSLYESIAFQFISPKGLEMPALYLEALTENNITFSESNNLEEVASTADVLYMTRIQKERIPNDQLDYQPLILTTSIVESLKEKCCILHPLPRQEELPESIDSYPHAKYFEQAKNGVYVRQALLVKLLSPRF